MKELSEMTTREFVDSLLHQNEYTKLDVYDELDKRTHGFDPARVDALLDLMLTPFPFPNFTTEERDMRFGYMTLDEWKHLDPKPSPSLYTIVIDEYNDSVKVRPKDEELFWYAYDTLGNFLNSRGRELPLQSIHCTSNYILAAFNNNKTAADSFINRACNFTGKRITTLVAIDMMALTGLGKLTIGQLTEFTKELNNLLSSVNRSIGYQGLHAALYSKDKKKRKIEAAKTYYREILNIESE